MINAKKLEIIYIYFYVFTTFENNFQMDQDSLQCDGTTAAILNDLFSESPSVVDSAVERIRTAWERKEEYLQCYEHSVPVQIQITWTYNVEYLTVVDL